MNRSLQTVKQIPAPTPQIAKGLSPEKLREHRDAIYSEVCGVLSAFYDPKDPPEVRAINRAWWCDELQDWTRDQVCYALRKFNRDNPDRRPTPGHIVRILKDTRGQREAERAKARLPEPMEPVREVVSKERAAQIMASVGFAPKRFGVDA